MPPETVPLTAEGREEARAAAAMLEGIRFDRVITSGLPRTLETARIVAPDAEPESWPELREIESGRLGDIPEDELERAFVEVWRDVVPEETKFLGGETIGSLLDRVLPALDRLLADPDWDIVLAVLHGGVNRAIISYALTGGRAMFGNLEQSPACINVLDIGDDWIVRAVNTTPIDLAHRGSRRGRWKSSGASSSRLAAPEAFEPLAGRAARAVEDGPVTEHLVLPVRGHRERVELEGDLPWAEGVVELARLLGLLDRMLEIRKPGAKQLLDPVADGPGAVAGLDRRRGEEAPARKDLSLEVAELVVAKCPDARQPLRGGAGRGDYFLDEDRGRVLRGGDLKLLLRPEVSEEPTLAHARRLGEPPDRKRLQALLCGQVPSSRENRLPCSLALRFQHGRLIHLANESRS